ncbi:amidohydrolase family protein [uncultured Kordia sp.]|uniref:amidohydrolase family protein n=1 Tax=uncultured Kordia sp. TaxID=507699 RepID=UPI002623AE8C|nr:amidohydrolase family protein [uncultured Kordia sp.]
MKNLVFLLFLYLSTNYAQEETVKVESIKMNPKGEAILIEHINIIDVHTGKSSKKSVLIRDKKIAAISKNIRVNDTTTITIDGTGKWLSPGMVDSHVHLFQSGSIYTRPDVFNLTKFKPYEDERKWLRQNAPDLLKRYLQAGITTITDVGGPLYNYKLRDLYNDNTSFPNIYLTGPLISTYQPKAFDIEDSPIIKASSPEEAIDLVKKQLPYKPDFIKIWYIASGNEQQNYDIVKATIEESHKHNLKVAVHATQLETAKRALKAKADILVHSVDDPIDKEFIDLLNARNVVYIPTLMVANKYTEAFAQEITFSTEELKHSNPYPIRSFSDYKHLHNGDLFNLVKKYAIARKNRGQKEDFIQAENLKLLQKSNSIIATGTDAGNIGTLHATSYQEEIRQMKEAGLSNLEIIQASTINAAKILDKEHEIGSIETSKLADLLILNSNPLEDIEALQNISHIIKGGSMYTIENVLKDSPENIVQKQVNAYNSRNVEAFLDTYSDTIEIYNFPNQLMYKGKEKIREIFTVYFKKYPELHCEILNRIVIGNKVIDNERVSIGEGYKSSEVIAIYIIENHKIAKVYFLRD